VAPLRTLYRGFLPLLVAFVVIFHGSAVKADPTVAQIEAQISEAWEKLEPIIEQYNKVHSQLVKNQSKAKQLQSKIMPLQLQVDLAMSQISDIAAEYYITGGTSTLNAMLSSTSPDDFIDNLSILDELARAQNEQMAQVSATKAGYDTQKVALDKLIAEQKEQDADLAAKKTIIEREMDKLQKLRQQAYGSSSSGGSLRIGACPTTYSGGTAAADRGYKVAKKACSLIGKPYVWGANGPNSYDCSGLTQAAWAVVGKSLTHYTGDQWKESYAVSTPLPGDLIFFYSDRHHVGIYLGKDSSGRTIIVHAPHSGDYVRMAYVGSMPIAGIRRPY
jgi:cell wall-associated NlpC family hydrolase